MGTLTALLPQRTLFSTPLFVTDAIAHLLSAIGLRVPQFSWVLLVGYLLLALTAMLAALVIVRLAVRFLILPIFARSKNQFDDCLVESKTIKWGGRIIPFYLLYFMLRAILNDASPIAIAFEDLLLIALLIPVTLTIFSLFNAINMLYDRQAFAKHHSIKGYTQIVKIIIAIAMLFVIIGIIFDVSLIAIVSGLGAFTAVIMLIFKDHADL